MFKKIPLHLARSSKTLYSPGYITRNIRHVLKRNILNRNYTSEFPSITTSPGAVLSSTEPTETQLTREEPFSPAVFWLNNALPIKRSFLDPRSFFFSTQADEMEKEGYKTLFPNLKDLPGEVEFEKSKVNKKEGGVYVHLKYRSTSLENLIEKVQSLSKENKLRSSLNWQIVSSYYVKGEPFMEDMMGRLPSRKLKIEFEGPDLSVESLYRLLRPFGKIVNIIPQPPSSKDMPRFVVVEYSRLRSASAAKNCVHGAIKGNTKISINYEKTLTFFELIMRWIKDHPRIMIPILLGMLAGTTYLVFDPLRVWFVQNKITSRYSLHKIKEFIESKWVGVTNGTFANIFSMKPIDEEEDEFGIWQERKLEKERILAGIKESPDSIMLLTGPRGSGKSNLINKVTDNIKYTLTINCEDLINIPEVEMLENLAKQTGFYPRLNFLVSASGLVDTLITATTGAKSSFSTNAEAQVKKILETLMLALTKMSVDQHRIRSNWFRRKSLIEHTINQEVDESEVPEIHYPVIVIEGFMSKERASNDYLYDVLAKWAVQLEENHVAHVIFVSSNPSALKTLSKAIPNRPIDHIALHDASPEGTLEYIRKRLGSDFSPEDFQCAIDGLGGRSTDVELLVQKIKAGAKPDAAYQDIIIKSVTELRKLGFSEDSSDGKKALWTHAQFWLIVKLLSRYDEIDYDRLRFHKIFNGDENPIQQMENAGLITLIQVNGRPYKVKASRPVYTVAFRQIVSDKSLYDSMQLMTSKLLQSKETTKIKDYENEMSILVSILTAHGTQAEGYFLNRETKKNVECRLDFLGELVGLSHKKIADWKTQEMSLKSKLKLSE